MFGGQGVQLLPLDRVPDEYIATGRRGQEPAVGAEGDHPDGSSMVFGQGLWLGRQFLRS